MSDLEKATGKWTDKQTTQTLQLDIEPRGKALIFLFVNAVRLKMWPLVLDSDGTYYFKLSPLHHLGFVFFHSFKDIIQQGCLFLTNIATTFTEKVVFMFENFIMQVSIKLWKSLNIEHILYYWGIRLRMKYSVKIIGLDSFWAVKITHRFMNFVSTIREDFGKICQP